MVVVPEVEETVREGKRKRLLIRLAAACRRNIFVSLILQSERETERQREWFNVAFTFVGFSSLALLNLSS